LTIDLGIRMCEASSLSRRSVRDVGESLTEQFIDSDTLSCANAFANSVMTAVRLELLSTLVESLILAQDERWRRA
jgi:hypothetical protein